MIKQIKHIETYFIVLITVIMASCGSGPNRQYEAKDSSYDDLEVSDSLYVRNELMVDLEKDSLHALNLKAFEKRAFQKLEDFADYIGLISDSTVDIIFRDQAREMALNLFASKKSKIAFSLKDNKIENLTLHNFIKNTEDNQYGKFSIELGGISPSGEIVKIRNIKYKGSFVIKGFIQKETKYPLCWMVNYEINRINKQFGEEKKEVWEVFLNDLTGCIDI